MVSHNGSNGAAIHDSGPDRRSCWELCVAARSPRKRRKRVVASRSAGGGGRVLAAVRAYLDHLLTIPAAASRAT